MYSEWICDASWYIKETPDARIRYFNKDIGEYRFDLIFSLLLPILDIRVHNM